jgi:hypothetical protein
MFIMWVGGSVLSKLLRDKEVTVEPGLAQVRNPAEV